MYQNDEWIQNLGEEIRDLAVSIDEPNYNCYAFPKTRAQEIVAHLNRTGLVILGGEFYKRGTDRDYEPIGMNWVFPANEIKNIKTCVSDSAKKARDALDKTWVQDNWFVEFIIEPPTDPLMTEDAEG